MDLPTYARETSTGPEDFRAKLAEHGVTVTKEIVRRWLRGEQPPGTKNMDAIEAATGGKVTRYDLRPDVFGEPPEAAQQDAAA